MFKPRLNQWVCGATATALVLGAVPLAGAAGRYSKKEDTVVASQTVLTKPQQKAEREKKKPDLTASDVFSGMGEELKGITDSQIKVLQRLIDVTNDDDPDKPDLLFRMAELYAEQQRYYNFRAREMDEKVFDAQQKNDAPSANKLKAQQKDFETRENQWLLAAVKQYISVADGPKYQTYKRMDQVLFYLAYLLTQVKKEEKARVYFKRLIKDYPQSPYLPHAYLSFGEFFFENRDLENALRFYEKVLQYPTTPVYGFALYKKGWVYYNLTDFKQALATFVEVVEYATNPKRANGKPGKGDAQLAKEAKKDIVRAYAQIGTPEKAWPFFQKYGKDYAPVMLEQLAELYNAQGKFLDSIKTYRELIKLNPGTTKLCDWQTEILKNTLSMTGSRAVPETVKELQRLSAVYEKTANMQGLKKQLLDECRDNTAGMLRELATVWHKEAQKTGVMDTYAHASDLYKEYLRRFPKEKDAYTMHYWYGELLFKLGSLDSNPASHWYCDAAPVYTDVVKMDPKGPKLKDAAYAAVISWKNCLDVADAGPDEQQQVKELRQKKGKEIKDEAAQKKADEERNAPKPIPEKQQKMLEAFDTYIQYVPESAELVTIKYRRARVFYEYNHFQEAMPLFQDIAEKHTKNDLAIYSANLLLDCMNILKEYSSLEQQVDRFLGMPDLLARDEEFKHVLEKLKLGTLRLKVEQTQDKGDYKQAALLYMQLADRYPNDPKIDEIYFNAGVDFAKAHLVGLSIQAYNKLIEVKPQSNAAKKAIYFVGQSYQSIASYPEAAEKYESFATQYPGEIADKETDPSKKVDASLALYTAVTFRRGLGQVDQAGKDVDQYLKNYGGRKEFFDKAAGVFFEQGQIYDSKKDYARLRGHLNQYLKDWAVKGGIDRQIIAEVKLGEIAWRESCPVPGENGACITVKRERASSASQVAAKAAKANKKLKNKKGPVKMQCGPETKSKIAVYDRKPAMAKEAMTHFQKALLLFKGGAAAQQVPQDNHDARVAAMTRSAAQAKMAEGDQQYEQLLSMKVPTGLTFDPKQKKKNEEAQRKFKGWIEGKTKKLQEAQKTYQAVILIKDAHWVIAAAARIGQLFQDFADGLYTTEVPQPPPPPPGMERDEWNDLFRNAYCDAMTDQAEPLDNHAVEGLSTCLSKSTELNWFNEWSRLCEAELNQIKAAEYPLASEIRAEPGYQTVPPDLAPLAQAAVEK